MADVVLEVTLKEVDIENCKLAIQYKYNNNQEMTNAEVKAKAEELMKNDLWDRIARAYNERAAAIFNSDFNPFS